MFKSKVKFLAVMACCSVLLLCSTLVFALGTQSFGGNVNIQYTAPPPTDDLWNAGKKTFYKANLNKLLQQISNDATSSTTNMATINSLATSKTTAKQIRAFSVGKSSGEDITVTLGGLKWTVTYLSTDTNGDPILTLWLDNCIQDAWKTRSLKEGSCYGYLNGGLYSDWSANWYEDNPEAKFPSHMYGASYIRAVTLNNGGVVATSGTASTSHSQDPNSAFALFTMASGGLTQYLDTPSQVQWQEYGQNTKSRFGFRYSCPNENWSDQIPNSGTYNGETYAFDKYSGHYYNYIDKTYNATWASDYLWLPSISETGYDDSPIGIWDLSVSQRYNANGSTSRVGSVGTTSGYAYNYSWLRSGYYNDADYAYYLSLSGAAYYNTDVDNSNAVRPALHLNLRKAAQAAV